MNGRNSSRKLIWADSLWVVRNGKKEFRNLRWYVDGETIFTESVTESVNSWESPSELRNQMRKWLSDIGYCMKGVGNETISKWLLQCDGKSVEAFEGLVREKIVNHAERKAAEKQTEAEWKRLSERFGGSVLGIDRKLDIYQSGFSVRVLLKSSLTRDDRRKLLKEHRTEIVKWVMEEVPGSRDFRDKIGSLKFYRPTEIVLLNAPEFEVKFEVKRTEGCIGNHWVKVS